MNNRRTFGGNRYAVGGPANRVDNRGASPILGGRAAAPGAMDRTAIGVNKGKPVASVGAGGRNAVGRATFDAPASLPKSGGGQAGAGVRRPDAPVENGVDTVSRTAYISAVTQSQAALVA